MSEARSYFDFGATRWSLIREACTEVPEGIRARLHLLERYHFAIYRFLECKLKNPHDVDHVYQRFADRIQENPGFLAKVSPEKGKFRNYLRMMLHNMVMDHYREQQKAPPNHPMELVAAPAPTEDEDFRKPWTDALMSHCWQKLQEKAEAEGKHYHRVLLFRAQHPDMKSAEIAAVSGEKLGKSLTEENIRQITRRAQMMLNDLFLDELARSLIADLEGPATFEQLEEELIDIGMFDSLRKAALDRRRKRVQGAGNNSIVA